MTIQWQALKPGDSVRIVAPCARTENAWDDLKKSCDYLRSRQLKPLYSEQIFQETPGEFYNFANSDDARYEDFVDALHSDAQAIWCFRGGYGCDRIITRLIQNNVQPNNGIKLFLGFSDITNLHSYINQQWNWATLHASVLKQFPLQQISPQDSENTFDIVFGKVKEVVNTVVPLNQAAAEANIIHGQITGGNLTTIQSALGTPWETDTTNKVLLLEDVGESAYRIARMLYQLLHNGYLDKASAILLGDFIPAQSINEVISEFVNATSLPIFRIGGVGHSADNYPLPLHTKARIEFTKNHKLIAETGAR